MTPISTHDPIEFAMAVLGNNAPDDETLDDETLGSARRAFGDRGVIERGALIAHYHSGAIVLWLSDIILPDGTRECLPYRPDRTRAVSAPLSATA